MTEILKKFKNGEKLYKENALFNICIHQILSGADIYHILEEVILLNSAQQNMMKDVFKNKSQK